MRRDIKGFLEIKIIDLIPDAFFIAGDDDILHPMSRAIIDAIAAICVYIRVFLCIAEWDRDLSHLSILRDVENWLLIIGFNGLDPAGVGVPVVDPVPGAVER